MSTIEVKVTKVEILPHDNAEKLQLARINGEGGFISVVGKNQFQTGDLALYVGPDSLLPANIQEHLSKVSKIKVEGGRIRAVKIRGIISEGLCLDPKEWLKPEDIYDGNEVSAKLGIVKYQPKVTYAGYHVPAAKGVNLNYKNEHFPEYTHIERFQKYPNVIKPGERVVITKKLHGMNCLQKRTPIKLYDGTTKTIGEIVDQKLDVELLGINELGCYVPAKIIHHFNNGKTKNWKVVRTEQGPNNKLNSCRAIICTDEHKFFNPNTKQYTECRSLVPGDSVLFTEDNIALSSNQKSILIGKMLGDACLHRSYIGWGHKIDHQEYVDETLKSLGNLANPTIYQRISGFGTHMYCGQTISSPVIDKLFTDWFTHGKKQVPKSIIGQLNNIILAYWYMDDGSLSHSELQRDRACIATCGFDEQSQDNLIAALAVLNLFPIKYQDTKGYWRLRFNLEDANKLFERIHPYIFPCMRYKLPREYKDLTFYKNIRSDYYYKPVQETLKIVSIKDYEHINGMNTTRYDLETSTHNYIANGVLVHNCRFGLTHRSADQKFSWWQKFKNIFVPEDPQIYLIGSHSSVRNAPSKRNKFVGDLSVDPFCCLADKYGMKTNLKIISKFFSNKDVVIYGERIGWASPETPVQRCKNYLYDYGVEKGRQELRVFDIMVDGQYLNWDEVVEICSAMANLPTVEVIYDGPWSLDLLKLAERKDTYGGKEYIREGIVVKPAIDRRDPHCGRVIFKQLNPEYLLLKDNTELQ